MTHLRIYIVSFLSLICSTLFAQKISLVGDNAVYPIQAQQTQTEVKPGWQIVDVQLKSKYTKYLWGAKAKQLADSSQPQFIVDTDSLLLSNMVLVKLKSKKEYRQLPKTYLQPNKCVYVDFNSFTILPHEKDKFLIRPLKPLMPGEYIFTFTTLSPVGELSDIMVWPFSVREE